MKPRGLDKEMMWKRGDSADPSLCSQARPLTRYLPVRKEDFDLKTHIESSGHGVDTCLHVVLSSKVLACIALVCWGEAPMVRGPSSALRIVASVPDLTPKVSVPGPGILA